MESNDLAYIDEMVKSVETALSSPESALLLSSLYDHSVGLTNPNRDEPLGPVLYREDEDLVACTRMDNLVKLYNEFDIKKFFGLNVNQFIDLSGWRINILINNAEEFMKELNKAYKEVEDDVGKNKEETNEIVKSLEK